MPLLIVTYDLKADQTDRKPFFDAIKNNSKNWWHYLKNTWLVSTYMDADTFAHKLYPFFTTDDRVLVMEVKGTGQGWLPKDAWEWIISHQTID